MQSILFVITIVTGSRLVDRNLSRLSPDCRDKIQEIQQHTSPNVSKKICLYINFILLNKLVGSFLSPRHESTSLSKKELS